MTAEPEYIDVSKLRQMFDPPPARATIDNWIAKGQLSPYKFGGKNYFKLNDVRAAIEGAARPRAEPKIVREASVTIVDMAPEAIEIAKAFLETGKIESRRDNWRFAFGHAQTKPSEALLARFALPIS